MRTIEPRFLIDEDLANITKEILKEDNILNIYIHNNAGPVTPYRAEVLDRKILIQSNGLLKTNDS